MSLHEFLNTCIEAIEMPLSYLLNTQKRIHLLYLFSSSILAYFIYYKSKKTQSFIAYLFNKKIWLSTSSYIDYSFIFFNSFIKLLLIAPFLIYGFYIAHYTHEFLLDQFSYPLKSLTQFETLLYYTISITVINDLMSYLTHYAMHKIPFLWEFHKIHHSATVLNPITQYRLHPVELIINNARGILIFGLITGIFDYLSTHQISKVIFLGANIFSFTFSLLGANLRHSHVRFTYLSFLEYIFISPFQHQIHHSNKAKHFDKNMGAKLAIWDWLFGTLILSKNTKKITFGLANDDTKYNTFKKNLKTPFYNIYKTICVYFHR